MEDKSLYSFSVSGDAKREYLSSLIGKMHKILHLFEERPVTGFSPEHFIWSQLWEINTANSLFDGKLMQIIVKVKGLHDNCDTIEYKEVKKQIFEIDKIIKSMLRNLK